MAICPPDGISEPIGLRYTIASRACLHKPATERVRGLCCAYNSGSRKETDMKPMTKLILWCCLALGMSLPVTWANAQPNAPASLKDTAALQGLQQVKGLFLLSTDEPARTAHVLKVIQETEKSLSKQGVKPDLIVVFLGPTVAFLTQDQIGISYKDRRAVTAVDKLVRELGDSGVRVEACGIALHGMAIKPDELLPQVHAVGNGFVSAIGYQAKGYALVPVP
jgi:intracellular sulfur oxidation DsrE/DsrF family protein